MTLREWSKAIRERDGKCLVCGKTTHLNAHHLLDKKQYKEFSLLLINGISLCPSCHVFGRYSAHRNGIWFTHWLRKFAPEHYDWVLKNM